MDAACDREPARSPNIVLFTRKDQHLARCSKAISISGTSEYSMFCPLTPHLALMTTKRSELSSSGKRALLRTPSFRHPPSRQLAPHRLEIASHSPDSRRMCLSRSDMKESEAAIHESSSAGQFIDKLGTRSASASPVWACLSHANVNLSHRHPVDRYEAGICVCQPDTNPCLPFSQSRISKTISIGKHATYIEETPHRLASQFIKMDLCQLATCS